MDAYSILRELWRSSDYMGALTAAWKLQGPDNYQSLLPSVQLRDLTLRELVFRACRQAVAISFAGLSERQRALHWVDSFLQDFRPPAVLIDHGDRSEDKNAAEAYRRAMLWAHFSCARAVLLGQRKFSLRTLTDGAASHELIMVAQETDLPLSFFGALAFALLPEEQRAGQLQAKSSTVSLTALLVGEKTAGIVATLTLELIPVGAGVLFPDPSLAFVRRDDAFRTAERNAFAYVTDLGLWHAEREVCWQLERRDGQALGALKGSSLGFAFALGLAKLLTPS